MSLRKALTTLYRSPAKYAVFKRSLWGFKPSRGILNHKSSSGLQHCRTFSNFEKADSFSHVLKDFSDNENKDESVIPTKSKEEHSKEYTDAKGIYLNIDYVVNFLKDVNASDMCVIKSSESRSMYVDYFIIVSGRSSRHIKAMASQLVLEAKRLLKPHERNEHICVEGLDCYDWMAVDLGNIAVHFFLPEMRHKLELEKLWTLGPQFDDQYRQMMENEKFLTAVYTGRNTNKLDSEIDS